MTRRGGFTLVEVMVSLAILAFAVSASLAAVGMASEDVIDTVEQRKMRYLIQNLLGDIEKGMINPDDPEEEEAYFESMTGTFENLASDYDPDEFRDYQWDIPVFREEVIVGAPDEDSLLEMGYEVGENGAITGSPVSGDPEFEGMEGEGEQPPGQIKRVLVFVIRRLGETAEEDREFTIMTYLPLPGEEEQDLGGEGGGEGGGPGAGGGEGTRGGEGRGGSGGSDTKTGSADGGGGRGR